MTALQSYFSLLSDPSVPFEMRQDDDKPMAVLTTRNGEELSFDADELIKLRASVQMAGGTCADEAIAKVEQMQTLIANSLS